MSGTLSSDTFGDVADCMIGPRFDPVLKPEPSFYRIALRNRRRPETPVGGYGARSVGSVAGHVPFRSIRDLFSSSPGAKVVSLGPLGDASAAFFFSKELGVRVAW